MTSQQTDKVDSIIKAISDVTKVERHDSEVITPSEAEVEIENWDLII